MKYRLSGVLAFLFLCGTTHTADTAAAVAAGALDPTFGVGGTATGPTMGQGTFAMIVQPEGKIVVAGQNADPFYSFGLVRYLGNGTPDATFGVGGTVVTSFTYQSRANALVRQPDNKLVAAGWTITAPGPIAATGFALARYLADGSLDPTFGAGGKVTTQLAFLDMANGLAIQSDGKLVAAGTCTPGGFCLARYNPDGTLDATFGAGGKVIVPSPTGADAQASTLIVQTDGKLVAAGRCPQSASTQRDFCLARFNAAGSLDTTFGTNGWVATDFGGTEAATALVLQTDGKLVAAGSQLGTPSDFLLARYNSNGSLDAGFGTAGKVTTDFFASTDSAFALMLQPDGKLIAAGGTEVPGTRQFGIARYNPDGSLDGTFGSLGKLTTDFGNPAYATALALQADGKMVAAGSVSMLAGGYAVALARYLADENPCVVDRLAMHPDSQLLVSASEVKGSQGGLAAARLDPAVFRRLRDEVLVRSDTGRRYAELYARHSPEVVRLMLGDRALRAALLHGLLLWQANAAALGTGRAVTVTADQARVVDVVLDRLARVGSPRLREAIEAERRTHAPGLTSAEAILKSIER